MSLLALLSGSAALAYEMAWFRGLGLLFGVGVHAVAAVTAAFLAGLGLGAALGGRIAGGRAGLRTYALLEAGAALCGVLVPWVLAALSARMPPPPGEIFSWHVAGVAFLVLLPATALLGATFPVLGRLAAAGRRRPARAVGIVYAANTAGGALGVLLAAAYSLGRLGLSGTSRAAALVEAGVAVLALSASVRRPSPSPREGRSRRFGRRPAIPPSVLAGTFFFGAAMLSLEILATRLLVALAGGTVDSFAAALAIFLTGGALGAALLAGHLAGGEPPLLRLGLAGVALAGATALGLVLLRLALASDPLLGPLNLPPEEGMFGPATRTVRLAAFLLLPPTLVAGALLPAAVRAVAGASRLQAGLGGLFAANVAGTLAGTLATVGFLLPRLGLRGAFAAPILLAAAGGGTVLLGTRGAGGRGGRRTALLLLLSSGALAAAALRPGATPGSGEIGLVRLFHTESPKSSVQVAEVREKGETAPVRSLFVDGKPVASTLFVDRRLQLLLGFLPAAAHPRPDRVLSVGLGTGMSSAALALFAQRTDVVELSAGVLEAARLFERWNAGLLDRPGVFLHHDDGRAFLRRTRERYDVVSTDPIHPWVAGSAFLFTVEYYRSMRDHLRHGGLLAQWIPLYQLREEEIAGILRSLGEVFAHRSGFVTGYDLVVLASEEPIVFDPERVGRRLAAPEARALLSGVGVRRVEDLLATYFAGEETLARLALRAPAPITDDRPWIEFTAAQSVGLGYAVSVIETLARCDDPVPLAAGSDPALRARVRRTNERLRTAVLDFAAAARSGRLGEARQLLTSRLLGAVRD